MEERAGAASDNEHRCHVPGCIKQARHVGRHKVRLPDGGMPKGPYACYARKLSSPERKTLRQRNGFLQADVEGGIPSRLDAPPSHCPRPPKRYPPPLPSPHSPFPAHRLQPLTSAPPDTRRRPRPQPGGYALFSRCGRFTAHKPDPASASEPATASQRGRTVSVRAAAAAAVEPVEAVDKGRWPSDGEAEEGGWSSCDGEEEEEEVGGVSEAGSEAWSEQGCTPLRTPQHGCTPLGWRGRLAEGEGEEEGESEEEDYDGEEEEDGVDGCVVDGCGGGFEAALPPDEGSARSSTRSSTPLRLHESPSSLGLPPTHDALFDDADELDGGAGRLKVELSRRLDEMVVAMDTGSPPAVTDLLLPADLLPVQVPCPAAPCPAAEVHEVTRDLDGDVDTPATACGEDGLEVGGGASGGWLEYLFGDASNELIGGGCCVVGCTAGGCGACAVGGGALEDAATWEDAGAAAAAAATAATGTAAEAPEAAAAAAAGVASAAVTVVAVAAAAAGMVTRRKKRSAVGVVTCADETCGAPPAKSPRSKKRPRGRAPSGKSWNCVAGVWEAGADAAGAGASASAPSTSEWPASATPQAPPVLVITLPAAARAAEATAPASPSLSCARAYSPAVRDGAPIEPPQLPPHADLRRDLATLKAATVLDAEEAAAADAEEAAAADAAEAADAAAAAEAAEAAEAEEAEAAGGLPELLQSPSLAGLYVIVGRGAPASGGGDKGLACPPCCAPPEAAAPPLQPWRSPHAAAAAAAEVASAEEAAATEEAPPFPYVVIGCGAGGGGGGGGAGGAWGAWGGELAPGAHLTPSSPTESEAAVSEASHSDDVSTASTHTDIEAAEAAQRLPPRFEPAHLRLKPGSAGSRLLSADARLPCRAPPAQGAPTRVARA